MHDLTRVVIRSGLIDMNTLAQFRKWGLMTPEVVQAPHPETPEQLVEQLDRALQDEDMVIVRETDLEALNKYLSTMKQGTLHLVTDDGTKGEVPVSYGTLDFGEYMMPWSADTIEEMLANGETYLITAEGEKVFFNNARELFFGEHKAFVVCKMHSKESHGTAPATHAPSE
jgi:hypothetical protein